MSRWLLPGARIARISAASAEPAQRDWRRMESVLGGWVRGRCPGGPPGFRAMAAPRRAITAWAIAVGVALAPGAVMAQPGGSGEAADQAGERAGAPVGEPARGDRAGRPEGAEAGEQAASDRADGDREASNLAAVGSTVGDAIAVRAVFEHAFTPDRDAHIDADDGADRASPPLAQISADPLAADDSDGAAEAEIIACGGPAGPDDWRQLAGVHAALGAIADPGGGRARVLGAGLDVAVKWRRVSLVADYTWGALAREDPAGDRPGTAHRLGLSARLDLLRVRPGITGTVVQVYAEAGAGRQWLSMRGPGGGGAPERGGGFDLAFGGGVVIGGLGRTRSGVRALLTSAGVRALVSPGVPSARAACRGDCAHPGQRAVAILATWTLAWGR